MIEYYNHHGNNVAVISELKGKHREHCLCYKCQKFYPGIEDNCKIAQATYEHCAYYGLVTPVYECPEYQRLNK